MNRQRIGQKLRQVIGATVFFCLSIPVVQGQAGRQAAQAEKDILLNSPERCGFNLAHERQLQQAGYRDAQERLEEQLYRQAKTLQERPWQEGARADEILTIPLVIHVVHLSSEPNPGDGPSNPTDAQILAGVEHLNQAYRNLGPYAEDGRQSDPALQSVDIGIEFCLAQRDINGNPTSGILRYASDTYSNLNYDTEDPQMMQWVANQNGGLYPGYDYANVWLVNEICQGSGSCNIAGFAYFPGGHGSVNNGVVNLARYWGSSPAGSTVHIHEFGHYLNLYHTFQGACSNNNCLTDGDRVCDTPPDNSTSYVSCGSTQNSCTTDADGSNSPFTSDLGDLYENFMDYSYENCQNTFTQGQKERMRAALINGRGSLLNSQGCSGYEGECAQAELTFFTDPIPSGTYEDAEMIFAAEPLQNNAEVVFQAAEGIILLPGFSSLNGSRLQAGIAPCAGSSSSATQAMADRANESGRSVFNTNTGAEMSDEIKLNIAPNPFSRQTQISYLIPQEDQGITLGLFDLNGRRLKDLPITENNGQILFTEDQLPPGMYYLMLRTKKKALTKKLFVIK